MIVVLANKRKLLVMEELRSNLEYSQRSEGNSAQIWTKLEDGKIVDVLDES